jgi:thiol-disulfide isomerase/thioredoxin
MLSMQVPTLRGGTERLLSDDKKRTLVFFFAPWCHVCAADMPNLRKVARAEEDVAVRLVALSWEDASEVRAFVSEHDWPGEVLLGNERLREAYQVSGFPTYYVLNQKGEILSASRGYATYAGLWLRLHW